MPEVAPAAASTRRENTFGVSFWRQWQAKQSSSSAAAQLQVESRVRSHPKRRRQPKKLRPLPCPAAVPRGGVPTQVGTRFARSERFRQRRPVNELRGVGHSDPIANCRRSHTFALSRRFVQPVAEAEGSPPEQSSSMGAQTLSHTPSHPAFSFTRGERMKAEMDQHQAPPGPASYTPSFHPRRSGGNHGYTFGDEPRRKVHNLERSPGPIYTVSSGIGRGKAFSFGPTEGPREAVASAPKARNAFEGFGFGCNVEEHIKYGRCLDGGCSARARWENTSSRKKCGSTAHRHGLQSASVGPWRELRVAAQSGLGERGTAGDGARSGLSQSTTPMHLAVLQGDFEAAAHFWSTGSDINAVDSRGCTVLHIACRANSNALARRILKWLPKSSLDGCDGIDVGARDEDGNTALHLSTMAGNVALVEDLLRAGADPEGENNTGRSPLAIATEAEKHRLYQILRASTQVADLRAHIQDVERGARVLRSRGQSRQGVMPKLPPRSPTADSSDGSLGLASRGSMSPIGGPLLVRQGTWAPAVVVTTLAMEGSSSSGVPQTPVSATPSTPHGWNDFFSGV